MRRIVAVALMISPVIAPQIAQGEGIWTSLTRDNITGGGDKG
jgi:hypothetical protein